MTNLFLKVIAGSLIGLILWLCVSKSNKDIGTLLTIAISITILFAATEYLNTFFQFIERVQNIANIESDLLSILFKTIGVGLISEISAIICKDAGNESIGKSIQTFSVITILMLSIPAFDQLLSLLEDILGTI